MSTTLMRRCKRLRRQQRGAVALEYALVAPLLFAVLLLSIEFVVMMLADSRLDAASSQVARLGRLGIQGGCEQAVQNVLRETLDGWVRAEDIRADVKIYTPGEDNQFGNVDDADYQPVCDAGDRGDMVIYRLGFDRPALTGIASWMGLDTFRFERTVLIQNEP